MANPVSISNFGNYPKSTQKDVRQEPFKSIQIDKQPILKEEENNSKAVKQKQTSNRNRRGLRALSLRVRDIVWKQRRSTYKEVAEYLIR